jgi:hypothetical protein
MAGFCDNSDEPPYSLTEFTEQQNNYEILKDHFIPWTFFFVYLA